jgi:hypothetical protein
MIGNISLPNSFVVAFERASVIHTTNHGSLQPRNTSYSLVTEVNNIENFRSYFQKNPTYERKESIVEIKRSLEDQDFVFLAINQFRQVVKEGETLLDDQVSNLRGLADSVFLRLSSIVSRLPLVGERIRQMREESEESRKQKVKAASSELPRDAGGLGEGSKPGEVLVRSHEPLIRCGLVNVQLVSSVALPLTQDECAAIRAGTQPFGEALKSQVTLSFRAPVKVSYGPWADAQRRLFLSHFKPYAYQNLEVYNPQPLGEVWHRFSVVKLVFEQPGTITVPFRDWGGEGAPPPTADSLGVDVDFGAGSEVVYVTELAPVNQTGCKVDLKTDLRGVTVTPSKFKSPMVSGADHLEVKADILFPTQWNQLWEFNFVIALQPCKLYWLAEYTSVITGLTRDWFSYHDHVKDRQMGDGTLEFFYPYRYSYVYQLTDFEIIVNVNENNIIDEFNNHATNNHVILKGYEIVVTMDQPWLHYEAPQSQIRWAASTHNISCFLQAAETHPLFELSLGDNQIFYAASLDIKGEMLYYLKMNPEYRDSQSIIITVDGFVLHWYGHLIRYIISLNDNLFSHNTIPCTTEEFRRMGCKNLKSLFYWAQQYETYLERYNKYETFLQVFAENNTVRFPSNCFSVDSAQSPVLRVHDLQVELRTTSEHFNFFMTLGPATITIPMAQTQASSSAPSVWTGSSVGASSTGNFEEMWSEKETYINLSDFSMSMHRTYGLPPLRAVMQGCKHYFA